MKKYLVALFVIFTACSGPRTMQKQIYYYGYDFRPYTANGFFITTEGYSGAYESIASLTTVMYPELKKDEAGMWIIGQRTNLVAGELSADEVIDSMYSQSKRMGADAIIRFNVRTVEKTYGVMVVEGIEVSGFAIKRK